jgi:beta-lactamase class C
MTSAALDALLRRITANASSPFHCPGFVLASAHGEAPAEVLVVGVDARGAPLDEGTPFPLCSATKLATALAVLKLVHDGHMSLDDELGRHLPEAAAAKPGVTIRRLLSHSSGLPLDAKRSRLAYDADLTWAKLASACRDTELVTEPGARVQYSNAGYVLLGEVLERLTARPLGDALRTLVLSRCDAEYWFGEMPPRPPAKIADVRSRHVGTPLENYNSTVWHLQAFPHRGLMTTARGALELVRLFRRKEPDWIRSEILAEALRAQTEGLAGGWGEGEFFDYDFLGVVTWPACAWGLGPEIKGNKSPHWAGVHASPRSFGHIGSTGCLLWVDPDADVAWSILATRTTDCGWVLRHGPAIAAAIGTPRPATGG